MDPRQTIDSFYDAFGRLDARAMATCYAEDAMFDDEVFSLRGRRDIAAMWAMLCDAARTQGIDHWRLAVDQVQASGSSGSAHWEAWYRFSATGRQVHNRIEASFQFAPDGRIARHTDRFGFWRWSRQALGAPGLLLGWTPLLRAKVRNQAATNLRHHQARSAA